jgi:hypothetical protein
MEKSELKLEPHSILLDTQIIEVFHEGNLIATVYGADGPGVRVVSKYPMDVVRGGLGETVGVIEIRMEPNGKNN